MKSDNKTLITNKELKNRLNAIKSDVYPLIKRDGTFICFIHKDTYIAYYGNLKDYPDKFVEDNYPDETSAKRIDALIDRYVQKHIDPSESAIDDMIAMRESLDANQDFTDKMMRKFPKQFFPNRYPV